MRVLVCGGRTFGRVPALCTPAEYAIAKAKAAREANLLRTTLDRLHRQRGFTVLIHGAADGADALADRWAKRNGLAVLAYPADWKRWGGAAGPIRNGVMLREGCPALVVAFQGGAGTANMVEQAQRAGIETLRVGDERWIAPNGSLSAHRHAR